MQKVSAISKINVVTVIQSHGNNIALLLKNNLKDEFRRFQRKRHLNRDLSLCSFGFHFFPQKDKGHSGHMKLCEQGQV